MEMRLQSRRMAAGLLASVLLHATALCSLGPGQSAGRPDALADVTARSSPVLRAVLAEPVSTRSAAAEIAAISPPAPAPAHPPKAKSRESVGLIAAPPTGLNSTEVFFKSSELDEQPLILVPVTPAYPPHARAHDKAGWVRLLLLIDESGTLRHLDVLEASDRGVFDEAATTAFLGVPFSPGRRGGTPVKSRMIVKVDFSLDLADTSARDESRAKK